MFFNRAGGAQHVQFRLAVQTVAGFDLDHGYTLGQQRINPRQGTCQQFFDTCGPRCAYG